MPVSPGDTMHNASLPPIRAGAPDQPTPQAQGAVRMSAAAPVSLGGTMRNARSAASPMPRVSMSRPPKSTPNVMFWQMLADDPDSFQLGGEPTSASLVELARHYSKAGQKLTITEAQPMDERAAEAWDIRVENGGTAHLMRSGPHLWINTAGLDSNRTKSGGGAAVYQLAASYAQRNKLKFRADPRGVKPAARLRRISHIISSILRHGDSSHFDPLAPTDDGYVEIPDWRPGQKDHNLAAALNREYHEVKAAGLERGFDIDSLTVDPTTNTIQNGRTGQPVTRGFYKALTARFDAANSGVGEATLLRALVVGSQRRAQESGGGAQWNVLLSRLHAAGGGAVRNGALLDGAARSAASAVTARRSPSAPGVAGDAARNTQTDPQDNELFRPFEPARKLLYSKPSASSPATGRVSAREAADGLAKLRATAPILAQGVRLVPNRDSLRQQDYDPADWDAFTGPDATEAFFDPQTGGVIVLTENLRRRAGETPARATARAILHERIGHAGLAALRQMDAAFDARWNKLMEAVLEDGAVADEIAALHAHGYDHLSDSQLVEEWFARQVESMTPEQLQALKPASTLGKLWQWLKDALRKLTGRFNRADWTARELKEIMALSRQALERGGPRGTGGEARIKQSAAHLPPLWDYNARPANSNHGNASLNEVIASGVQGGRTRNLKLQVGTVPEGRMQAGKFVWMDDSFVTHALGEHGDERREDTQGQEALTAADFAMIPHVVSAPDAVTPNAAAGGKKGVRFEKRVNGTLVFVTAEPNAKGQLRAVTMWKRRVGRVMPSKAPASTSATGSLTPGGANATPQDRAERSFGKRVRADERLDPQMREHFGDPIVYDVAHNADTLAAANDFISQHGLRAAADTFFDQRQPMPPHE